MYVCVCYAVTDSEIQGAIDAGATSCEAVAKACRAGGDCGSCRSMIEDMIEERHERSLPVLRGPHAPSTVPPGEGVAA